MPKMDPVQVPEPATERKLAVNINHLEYVHPEIRRQVLAGKLNLKAGAIVTDKEKPAEEAALAFNCDTLTAAIACDVLNSNNRKMGDRLVRIYLLRGENWVKLPYNAVLTRLVGGKVKLNLQYFPEALELAAASPKATELLEF